MSTVKLIGIVSFYIGTEEMEEGPLWMYRFVTSMAKFDASKMNLVFTCSVN